MAKSFNKDQTPERQHRLMNKHNVKNNQQCEDTIDVLLKQLKKTWGWQRYEERKREQVRVNKCR